MHPSTYNVLPCILRAKESKNDLSTVFSIKALTHSHTRTCDCPFLQQSCYIAWNQAKILKGNLILCPRGAFNPRKGTSVFYTEWFVAREEENHFSITQRCITDPFTWSPLIFWRSQKIVEQVHVAHFRWLSSDVTTKLWFVDHKLPCFPSALSAREFPLCPKGKGGDQPYEGRAEGAFEAMVTHQCQTMGLTTTSEPAVPKKKHRKF